MKAQKRVCLMAAACGLAVSAAHAQVAIVSNVAGSFNDISGGAPVVTGDDSAAGVTVSAAAANAIFPAGTLSVCTNGHAGYGVDTEYGNGPLPNTVFYGGSAAAAVLWDDLITHQPAAGVYAQEVNEGGVTVLVVEWVRMDHYVSSPDNATFELKIYGGGTATSGTGPGGAFAQYIYSHVLFGDPTLDNGASATIGFQYNGTSAEQYSYNTASIQDGTVLSLIHGTTGACCLNNGNCAQLSSTNCTSQGGTYRGDGSDCATANCPRGACCLADGSCVDTASAGCGAQGGVYRGDGTACATTACPTGACCTGDGCMILAPNGCTAQGGIYHGDNSTCAQAGCPVNLVANGGFETGDFTSWTVTPASSGSLLFIFQGAAHSGQYDAGFGAVAGQPDTISQTLPTTPGGHYTFDFWLYNPFAGSDSIQAFWDGNVVLDQTPTGATYPWTHYAFPVVATGSSTVISFAGYDGPNYNHVDDVHVFSTSTTTCYANCDGSTAVPFLNIGDFVCFQSAFAAGSSYANCDGSTAPPVLNIGDFVCFQSAFAAGCSAP